MVWDMGDAGAELNFGEVMASYLEGSTTLLRLLAPLFSISTPHDQLHSSNLLSSSSILCNKLTTPPLTTHHSSAMLIPTRLIPRTILTASSTPRGGRGLCRLNLRTEPVASAVVDADTHGLRMTLRDPKAKRGAPLAPIEAEDVTCAGAVASARQQRAAEEEERGFVEGMKDCDPITGKMAA